MRNPAIAVVLLGLMIGFAGLRVSASAILWTFETGG
jgi:hypothetical protein